MINNNSTDHNRFQTFSPVFTKNKQKIKIKNEHALTNSETLQII